MDVENFVHVAQIDTDAARRRVDLPFERCAGAEGNDRHAERRANPHHVLNVSRLLRHHHRIGRLRRKPCRGVGMLIAHRLRGDEAIAEAGGQRFEGGSKRLRLRPAGHVGAGQSH